MEVTKKKAAEINVKTIGDPYAPDAVQCVAGGGCPFYYEECADADRTQSYCFSFCKNWLIEHATGGDMCKLYNSKEYREKMEEKKENVNHPSHYNDGDIECIDAAKAMLTDEEFRGAIKFLCLKYIWREKHKNGDEDLRKVKEYIDLYFERRKE